MTTDLQFDSTAVLSGYVSAWLWTHYNEKEEHYDSLGYSESDVDPSVLDEWLEMLCEFIESHTELVQRYARMMIGAHGSVWCWESQFGHDFLLTQDCHGTGFWDRGLDVVGDRLTELVQPYGESDFLYVGEDGMLRR